MINFGDTISLAYQGFIIDGTRFDGNYYGTFDKKVNLNASYVSELENGKYGPTFEKIEEIAKVLNIKVYKLFEENDNTHKTLPKRVDMK